MRGLFMTLLMLSAQAAASASGGSWDEALADNTFFRLGWYAQSPEVFNANTRAAFNLNATYTLERGTCANASAGGPPKGLYNGTIQDTTAVNMRDVTPSGSVLTDGCGLIFAGEPTYYDSFHGNVTWARDGTLSLDVGVGCTTRVVNGTWDNMDPEKPGGGYHKEYLLPVEENTQVTVDGETCFNETLIHGQGGYPTQTHSVRIVQVNCSLENKTQAHVKVTHTCGGYVILSSAYRVMGYKVDCDEEAIKTWVYNACCNTQCFGITDPKKMAACNHACSNTASNLAHNGCKPRKSPPANCPTPPKGKFGLPEDGSSVYYFTLPKFSEQYCVKFCNEYWDQSNTCMNNRVSYVGGQKSECTDSRDYLVNVKPAVSCDGGYLPAEGGLSEGWVDFGVDPDIFVGFALDDIFYKPYTFMPRYIYLRIFNENLKLPGMRTYSLLDGDYRVNESHNDTGFFGFQTLELTDSSTPRVMGERFMLRDFTKGNGTYHLRFVFKGSVENLTANRLSIVTVGDRINSATGAKCEISNPCPPNFYCIEGICADLSKTPAKQVINLSECLKRVNPTNLTLDAPSSVGEGANFTVTAALSADNLALAGEGIWLYCMGSVINGTTDSAGRVSYHLMAGSGGSTCTATFQGASSYGPSKDSRYVGVNMPLPVCEPWMVVFFGVMVLLAVFFSVAEGRFKLFDVYQKLRELVR